MGRKTPDSALINHSRPPSQAELEAFNALHRSIQNVALLPVVVNGEQRFALALIKKNGEELTSLILGYLAIPEDKLLTVNGSNVPPMRTDVLTVESKDLH